MNKFIIPLLVFSLFLGQLALTANASAAQNIDDLVHQGKLSINLQVNQKEKQIVGQALVIAIEISTDRWFSTGSKIQHFTLPDVVMQANNTITINGSKRIKGQTWATQTHEITLYPTAYGDYQVPPINVDISVNTEHDGIVSGILTTQETTFNTVLPEALKDIDDFIVSPEVKLSIDGQFDQDKYYAVGEALTQTITITAIDTPAMMITPINFVVNNLTSSNELAKDTEALDDLAGLSIYHKPAQIFDKSNRGTLLGTRVESFTYIFEKPGSYTIDEQVIYWWNSQSSTLERLLIPASAWTVSGGLNQVGSSTLLTRFNFTHSTIILISITLLLLSFCYLGFIKRHYLSAWYNKVTKREQRLIRRDFLASITKKNYLAASQYLYQYELLSNTQADENDCLLSQKLNQLAFNNNSSLNFSINEAKELIKTIDANTAVQVKYSNFSPKERISLNGE